MKHDKIGLLAGQHTCPARLAQGCHCFSLGYKCGLENTSYSPLDEDVNPSMPMFLLTAFWSP